MTTGMRRTIAVYEMLTFVGTLANVVITLASLPAVPPPLYAVGVVALLAGGASLLAGIWLWSGRLGARRLSLIVQAVQVPRLALGGIVEYGVALGLSAVLRFGAEPAAMNPPVHLVLGFGQNVDGCFIGVNVLAAAAFTLLARWRPESVPISELTAPPA